MGNLHTRIKDRRLALGMTQLELGEAVGVREATINRYESGDIKNLKREMIIKLAEKLKCSPIYLMGWSDALYPEKVNNAPVKGALLDNKTLIEALTDLSDDELQDILLLARFLKSKRGEK